MLFQIGSALLNFSKEYRVRTVLTKFMEINCIVIVVKKL